MLLDFERKLTCNCCNSFNADSDDMRSSSPSISCLNSIFSYSERALLRSNNANYNYVQIESV